jgi:hypothetical protein
MQRQCQVFEREPGVDCVHAGSGASAPTNEELRLAARLAPRVAARFPRAAPRSEGALARKLALLRRNLGVTCAQRLWPLRAMVTAEQMVQGVLRDLERTWEGLTLPLRAEAAALDFVLLDATRPLRPLLRDLRMPLDAAARFEAHCRREAARAGAEG